jgi:hypothetical protein
VVSLQIFEEHPTESPLNGCVQSCQNSIMNSAYFCNLALFPPLSGSVRSFLGGAGGDFRMALGFSFVVAGSEKTVNCVCRGKSGTTLLFYLPIQRLTGNLCRVEVKIIRYSAKACARVKSSCAPCPTERVVTTASRFFNSRNLTRSRLHGRIRFQQKCCVFCTPNERIQA